MSFGLGEGLLILAVVLLLFGGKKIPQLASALGRAVTNFKKGMNEEEQSKTKEIDKDS